MNLRLSTLAGDATLRTIADLLDGGTLELVSNNGAVLAVLRMSDPAAEPPADGELTFRAITEDPQARASGKAASARLNGRNGDEVMECDVSGMDGDGVIKLNTTSIVAGGPVRIKSFTLIMPTE